MNQSTPQPPAIFFDEDYIQTLAREETIIYKRAVVNEINSLTPQKKIDIVKSLIKRFGKCTKYDIQIHGVQHTKYAFIWNINYFVKGEKFTTPRFNEPSYHPFASMHLNAPMSDHLITVKHLKKSCKDNGIKKYSKFSKLELVKVLMKV